MTLNVSHSASGDLSAAGLAGRRKGAIMTTAPTIRVEARPVLSTRSSGAWRRRVFATLMILVGLAFATTTLVVNLFYVGPAFDRLTDGFRPIMTAQSIQTNRQDLSQLSAAGTQIQTQMLPALAQQLNMTPAQMQQLMSSQFPAVAAGLQAIPTVTPTFNGLLTTLDQQRPLFNSADAIPTSSLPATTVPWSLLGIGIVIIAIGAYAWVSPKPGAAVAMIVGALVIVVPLSLSLTFKASDADKLNANLKPVYTQQMITHANGSLTTLGAMGTQFQSQMLPALAAQLKMTPAQAQQFLGHYFPATATALKNMPASMNRFHDLIARFQAHLNDYKTLKPVTFLPVVWLMIGGGIVLMLTGIGGYLTMGRSRRSFS
jgi:hypothetical protein